MRLIIGTRFRPWVEMTAARDNAQPSKHNTIKAPEFRQHKNDTLNLPRQARQHSQAKSYTTSAALAFNAPIICDQECDPPLLTPSPVHPQPYDKAALVKIERPASRSN